MKQTDSGRRGYKSLVAVLKKERHGLTAADMAAKTALPLHSVRELAAAAADEYGARLKVTESGEILYSFPGGFTSRYRGPAAKARRCAETILGGLGRFFRAAFKVWITVMLAGYFVLFVIIALAALVFIMAASASSNGRGGRRNSGGFGGAFLLSRMLNLVVRFWFYSSLLGQGRRSGRTNEDRRPLFKKVFSFVFGDGEPNEGRERSENEELTAYLRANRGVISLPEFMIHTGLDPQRADRDRSVPLRLHAFVGIRRGFAAFTGGPDAETALEIFEKRRRGQHRLCRDQRRQPGLRRLFPVFYP